MKTETTKKQYVPPRIEVMEVENEGVINFREMKTHLWSPLWTAVLLTALLAGCTDTNEPVTDETIPAGKRITLVATQTGADTRTEHTDASAITTGHGLGITWAAGDRFTLYQDAGGETFTLDAGQGGSSSATFTGNDPAGTGSYHAFYPAAMGGLKWTDCRISALGQIQKGATSTAHLSMYDYMTAELAEGSSPSNIVFTHRIAFLKFIIDLGTKFPKTLTLSTQDGADIAVVQDAATGGTVTKAKQLSMYIQNAAGEAADFSSFTAYMAVLPSTLTNKLALTVMCTDGTNYTYNVTPASNVEYAGGKVYDAKLEIKSGGLEASTSVFSTTLVAATKYDGGKGTATEPYLIANAAQLKYLVNQTNEDYSVTSNTYYKLTTDIHVTADVWTSIGKSTYSFQGKFDGGGHTISGELKNNNQTGVLYFGFFGRMEDAEVKNLHIAAKVTGGTTYAGSIAGLARSSQIADCTASGGVHLMSQSETYRYLGGIVGYIGASTSGTAGSISNCSVYGELTTEDKGLNLYIGGIVGWCNNNQQVLNCTSTASIPASAGTITKSYGGIAGMVFNKGKIAHCINRGQIGVEKLTNAGGITGYVSDNTSSVENCRNFGEITIQLSEADLSQTGVGGITGVNNGSVRGCYNEGSISDAGSANHFFSIGGIAGNNQATGSIHTSTYTGEIQISHLDANQVGSFGTRVGGLAGYNEAGKVYPCNINTGKVWVDSFETGKPIGEGNAVKTEDDETGH